MKTLNYMLEGILDQDLDINIISFAEFVDMVKKKMTTKQIKEFVTTINMSFEKAEEKVGAHNYFGVIEVWDDYLINIYYDPHAKSVNKGHNVVGGLRHTIKINLKTGKRQTDTTGCHWLMEPCYLIPWTKENFELLQKLYAE